MRLWSLEGVLGVGLFQGARHSLQVSWIQEGDVVVWMGDVQYGDLPLPMKYGPFPTKLGWNHRSHQFSWRPLSNDQEGERARTWSQQLPELGDHLMGSEIKFWMTKSPSWNFPLWLPHWGGLGLWEETTGEDPALKSQEGHEVGGVAEHHPIPQHFLENLTLL